MATVFTKNSPTPFCSNAIHQTTTPNTKSSVPVVQKQNTPAVPTLEEKAVKLLAKSGSSMKVDDAQGMADALEKVSREHLRPSIGASDQ